MIRNPILIMCSERTKRYSQGKSAYSSFDDSCVSFMSDDLICVTVSIHSRIVTAIQREKESSRKTRRGIIARVVSAFVRERNDGYILDGQSRSQKGRDKNGEFGKGRHCIVNSTINNITRQID